MALIPIEEDSDKKDLRSTFVLLKGQLNAIVDDMNNNPNDAKVHQSVKRLAIITKKILIVLMKSI